MYRGINDFKKSYQPRTNIAKNENRLSSCLYRASMTIKTLYYPTDAKIYNS